MPSLSPAPIPPVLPSSSPPVPPLLRSSSSVPPPPFLLPPFLHSSSSIPSLLLSSSPRHPLPPIQSPCGRLHRPDRPPGDDRPAVPAGRCPRQRERRPVRVCRRSAAHQRARRLRPEHHHAPVCRQRRGHRRVREGAPRGGRLRRDLAPAAAGHHLGRGQGLRTPRRPEHPAHRHHGGQGRRVRAARRGEHDHAAARTPAVPAGRVHARRRVRAVGLCRVGAQDQGSHPLDTAREALHQARDPDALLQHDVLRPRRVRRRVCLAALLGQVGQRPVARGGGHAGGDHPGQRQAEPVPLPRRRAAAAQLRAAADGRGRLHHAGRRRPRKGGAHRDGRAAGAALLSRRLLRRVGTPADRVVIRRQAALRKRPVRADDAEPAAAGGGTHRVARRPPPYRQTAGLPQAAQRRRRGPDDRDIHAPALAAPHRPGRRGARCGDGRVGGRDPGHRRPAGGQRPPGRLRVDR